MKAMMCENFTLPWKVRWWWASKPAEPCNFWNYWKSWGSFAGWVIRRRFVQPRPGNRSMIGARLMLHLRMREDGFPDIWMPSSEQRDLRALLRDRHQWGKIRTRVQNTLPAVA